MKVEVYLKAPIKRGDSKIEKLKLSEPNAGHLRGLKLINIIQMDSSAYEELLPRICDPVLTDAEFRSLSMADLMNIMKAISVWIGGEDTEGK